MRSSIMSSSELPSLNFTCFQVSTFSLASKHTIQGKEKKKKRIKSLETPTRIKEIQMLWQTSHTEWWVQYTSPGFSYWWDLSDKQQHWWWVHQTHSRTRNETQIRSRWTSLGPHYRSVLMVKRGLQSLSPCKRDYLVQTLKKGALFLQWINILMWAL